MREWLSLRPSDATACAAFVREALSFDAGV
jgi:hypothetical protein